MMSDEYIPLNSWKGRIDTGRQGPKRNITNLMLHMRNIRSLGPQLAFNDLSGNIEWKGEELKDSDYVDVRLALEAEGFEPNAKDVPACVLRTAEDRTYNPVSEYLEGLIWDQKSRASTWLPDIFGADDTKINRAFGRMFLISAVARALNPGCQVDTMLIIEGEQGIRKDTAIRELFGPEYVMGSLINFKSKEVGLSMQGVWAISLGELEAFGAADIRTIKNFITLRRDDYRPPWGRHFVKRPRRVVFIGSTNEENYLRDPTGARRFWPFKANKVDIDKLRRDRDQLWAEAVHAFKAGEQWWIDKGSDLDAMAQEVQSDRFKEDVWAQKIDSVLESPERRLRVVVTSAEVLKSLDFSNDRMGDDAESRVIGHLKIRGWHKHKCLRHGQNLNWWFPPDVPYEPKMGRPRGG